MPGHPVKGDQFVCFQLSRVHFVDRAHIYACQHQQKAHQGLQPDLQIIFVSSQNALLARQVLSNHTDDSVDNMFLEKCFFKYWTLKSDPESDPAEVEANIPSQEERLDAAKILLKNSNFPVLERRVVGLLLNNSAIIKMSTTVEKLVEVLEDCDMGAETFLGATRLTTQQLQGAISVLTKQQDACKKLITTAKMDSAKIKDNLRKEVSCMTDLDI